MVVNNSGGSSIGDSVLISTQVTSAGVNLGPASPAISLASSTIAGGSDAAAISITGTYGTFNLSSNTVRGGAIGLMLPSDPLTLSISSLTFQALSPGATGIHIVGGSSIYNISSVAFNSANIAVSVNASLMGGGSINMIDSAGRRRGVVYENDPAGRVTWTPPPVLPSGCGTGFNVAKDGSGESDTIQRAIKALPPYLGSTTCIVIRDTQTYSEQVTVGNIDTAGYRLVIMADPTFVSSAPAVNPPVLSMAAFQIMNDSVTVQGINIISTNTVAYGILSSSASANISGVNVISGNNINGAGILISSYSAVSYSSITVQNAHGLQIEGSSSTVSFSTMTSNFSGKYALYLLGAASNTITNSYIYSPAGDGAYLKSGANYNAISYSTFISSSSRSALYIYTSDHNTVTDSYIYNPKGYAARLSVGSSYNNIFYSTMTSEDFGYAGLYISNASEFNTITGSYIRSTLGRGAFLDLNANNNAIEYSTMACNNEDFAALSMTENSSTNTVTGSYLSNTLGRAAYFDTGGYNTIEYSTITGGGSYEALYIRTSSVNIVSGSYIQGSTAAYITGSTGTVFNSTIFAATDAAGHGLRMSGSVDLALTSSTFSGGPQGAGIYLDAYNSGAISFSSNTISGGKYGVNITTQGAGAALSISSLTFSSLTPGATAINFLGGQFVSTFTGMGFNAGDININGRLLNAGSRITVRNSTGTKDGLAFENDPNGYVDWEDLVPPTVGILTPVDGSILNAVTELSGTASDNVQVSLVQVSIKNETDLLHWNGSAWTGVGPIWLNCAVYPSSWTYTSLVPAISDNKIYTIVAKAADTSSNYSVVYATTVFTGDTVLPLAMITLPYGLPDPGGNLKALAAISGTASDLYGLRATSVSVREADTLLYYDVNTSTFDSVVPAWLDAPAIGGPPVYTWNSVAPPLQDNRNYELQVLAVDLAGNIMTPGTAAAIRYDITLPLSLATSPANGSFIRSLDLIAGTAEDLNSNPSGLAGAQIRIQRAADAKYWDGNAWAAGENWLDATGLTAWVKADQLPLANNTPAGLEHGKTYMASARAYDVAGNTQTVTADNSFIADFSSPTAHVSQPLAGGSYNALALITGTAADDYNSGFPQLRLYDAGLNRYWLGGTGTCGAATLPGWVDGTCAGFPEIWNVGSDSSSVAGTFNWQYDSSLVAWPDREDGLRVDVKASDQAGNYSISWSTFSYDSTPPSPSATLAAGALSSGAVYLAWSAAGDDGAAGALNNSTFTVQFSTDPVAIWDTSAAQINISTTGVLPGFSQTYTLGGLAANTSYYFRLWTRDDAGNYSGLSNGATGLTLIETPAGVYMDGVGTTTIVASAYALSLTGLDRGISGVNIATGAAYGVWGSTGNFWAYKTAMNVPRGLLAAGVIGGKLYAIGGFDGTRLDTNEEYDPVVNTWETKAVMTTARQGLAVGVIGGKLYAVGGTPDGGSPLSINEEYDPVTGEWATRAAMPTARQGLAAGVINGKLYAIGGNGGANLTVNEQYDPELNRWAAKNPMNFARNGLAVGVVDGKLYAVGGFDGVSLPTNEEYDPVSGDWTVKTAMSTARYDLAAGAIGGKLYIVGGAGNLAANEEYNPANGTWAIKAVMPSGRYGLAAGVIGGRLYAVGGVSGSFFDGNEEYTPGTARVFSGLEPNRLYTFRAKARNQEGTPTLEGPLVSTYTLATVALSEAGTTFVEVFSSSVTVAWSSGTAVTGYNGVDPSYIIQASTAADFSGTLVSPHIYSPGEFTFPMEGLASNSTYHFRMQAWNAGGMTDHSWLTLGTTVTHAITPIASAEPFGSVNQEGFEFSWGANGNSAGTRYTVQISSSSIFDPPVINIPTLYVTTTAVGGVLPNTTWYARVAAVSYSGVYTDYYVIGSTLTRSPAPSQILFNTVSTRAITVEAYSSYGFPNLSEGLSGIRQAKDGAYANWQQGVNASFTSLAPNKEYFFKAQARDQTGLETAESPEFSTYTLATVSLPQSGPLFSEIWLTSMTINWSSGTAVDGFNGPGAVYRVQVDTANAFASLFGSADTGALFETFPTLWPNTTHYFRALGINTAGIPNLDWLLLGSTSTLANQVGGISLPQVYNTSVTVNWTPLPPAPGFDTSEGYRVEASTAADFSGIVRSSSTGDSQLGAISVPNLLANATYYFRVGSLNWDGVANYAEAGSTKTLTETEPPTIDNNEPGYDYTWYSAPTKAYDIDFHDTGGSALEDFRVRATTGPLQTGLVTAEWMYILTDIGADDYISDWTLDDPTWNLLQDGTNYMTVRVYDGSNNMNEEIDSFMVFKDTTPPSISENVDDTIWQNASGASNILAFFDEHSKVNTIEYTVWSAPAQGGEQLVPWTTISSDLNTHSYTTSFVIEPSSWALLQSGTSYVTLQAWDYAMTENTNIWSDAFVVLKDTVAPAAINSLVGLDIYANSVRLGFSAPLEFPSGLAEYAVQYASYTVAWSTSAVESSTHVYVSTSGVTGGQAQAIDVPGLGPNTTYYFRIWARDQAGNWSSDSNSDAEATLAEKPVLTGAPQLYVSSAAFAWTPVDSRGYIVEVSTDFNFSGDIISSVSLVPSAAGLSVPGLSPNTGYYLRAGSLNWGGAVNYGSIHSYSTYAIEPASAAVFMDVSSTSVTVEWLSNGNGPGTRYVVSGSSDNFTDVSFSSITPTLYPGPFTLAFEGLLPNTTYWFKVKAWGNNGDYSAELVLGSTVTLPVPPLITGYALWSSSAVITWDANGNGAGTVYDCDLSTALNFSAVEISSRTTDLGLALDILSPNTTYYLRLRALSAVSQPSAYAQDSGLSRAAAPTGLGIYTVGPNSVGLYWNSGENPGGLGLSAWGGTDTMPAGRYGHSAAVAGDILLLSGGSDGTSYRSEVWAAPLSVTGELGSWRQSRSLPGARYGHGSAALKGRLYIIGGYDGTAARSEVWSAPVSSSGSLGEWAAEEALPQALYAHAAIAYGETLYVFGGYGAGARDEVWKTELNGDGTLAGWTQAGTMPQVLYAHAVAVAFTTGTPRLFLSGGNDGAAARSETWTVDVDGAGMLTGWTPATSLPNGLFGHAMAGAPNGLFVAGGNNGSMARTTTLRAAVRPDGTLGAWETQGALPQAIQSHALVERSGKLIALGGYDGAVSKDSIYSSVISGTEYSLSVTGASFSSTPWAAAGYISLGGLIPDTSYIFSVAARNYAGVVTAYAPTLSTFTYAAQPSTAAFSGVYMSSVQVNWLVNDNHAAVTYQVELASDAAHTLPAGALSVTGSSAIFTGIEDNLAYYARVRAVNNGNIHTAWTNLGSTSTRANPALDFLEPSMINNQAGDNAWRNAAGAVYNIGFADAGGAYLSYFQIRASTSSGGTGPFNPDWIDVAANINSSSYTGGFSLEPSTFSLLAPGTNYISVRVFDGNANSSVAVDAFYILKDTVAPVITDPQGGETAWRMDDAGAIYDVDFADALSGLGGIEYSASPNQGSGDAAALAWTPIAALSTGPAAYNDNWGVDFAALANDATNYISVRAWDLAGSTVTVSGIDVFKILKYVSGPEVAITAPDTAYRSAVALITGTASDARSHAMGGTELSFLDAATGKYWNGADFLAPAPVWLAVSTYAAWSYAPSITWAEGAQYQVVARSSDTAGNYSVAYATRAFTFDSLEPVISYTSPASGSSVNSAASLSGTAFDVSGIAGMALMFQRSSDDKWWDFNTGTWTVSGSSVSLAAGAGWSFSLPELLKASLENGASYYYSVYADDNSVPQKNIGFGGYPTSFGFIDDTAPAAIADFTASTGNAPGNISLAWHAPGDDGAAGMILYGAYKIQHSTMPLVVFSTADAQTTEDFTAVSAGSARSKELAFLVPGETYYLRAWTLDDAGNWSALSNGATAQAAPYPDRIGGHVMKVSSEGITGVLVEAFDIVGTLRASAFTLSDGSGTYVLSPLPSGSYRVQATWTADDIISSVGSDGITLGASNADFTLAITYELASIGGELIGYRLSAQGYRAKGARVKAASVELYQHNRLIATAPVDAAGKFLIKNLLPGKYVLKVPDAAGGSKELSVSLKAGEALVISPLGELLKNARVYAYPNPAGRLVTFHVETDYAPVTKQITVFDITGRAIKEFKNADFVARNGGFEADWNIPAKVASGVYVYAARVKFEATGEYKKTVKKFAIIK